MPTQKKPTPPAQHFSDLDLSQWQQYDSLETSSLWLFGQREKSGGHQLDYHGNCVPQIFSQLLPRFTKANDVVLDLFLGSGTSAIEAVNLNRQALGVELQPHMAQYVQDKLAEQGKQDRATVVCADSQSDTLVPTVGHVLHEQFGQEHAQFLVLHPPYDDIIRFSDNPACLSNQGSIDGFLDGFQKVAQNGFDLLAPGRFAALIIGDKYADSEWHPLGFQCLLRMNAVGFKTKSIIVKNMAGNEKGKGKSGNLWRYRSLAFGFYVFGHEYVMLCQKPAVTRK